jgi:hypothetical protein
MGEIPPRIGIVRLASEKYLGLFRDQIVGIVEIGSFFNPQLERFPRDIDLIVVTPNSLAQEVMTSRNLITYQIHRLLWNFGLRLPVQIGIWPETVDPAVPWYDPVIAESVKRGLVLAGLAPKWPIDG